MIDRAFQKAFMPLFGVTLFSFAITSVLYLGTVTILAAQFRTYSKAWFHVGLNSLVAYEFDTG